MPDLSRKRERERLAIRHTPYFQRIGRAPSSAFVAGPIHGRRASEAVTECNRTPCNGSELPEPLERETARQASPSIRDLRVLLADGNRDAADTCATLLELAGQQVRTAYSGRQALSVAESLRPQVVPLDIGLPDLDGYRVAKTIRGASWGKGVVLVAVTGWGRDDDRERAFAAGFDHHLTKPIAGEALKSLLASLDGSRSDAAFPSNA